jgi:LPXTG-site transpeptidase (sortase) family protein
MGSETTSNVPEYFELSIPKLGIKDARVETNPGDLDPDDALGRYVGSALPGENGNIFIYGHSVLPWFFNPENYKTIFSTIEELEAGDTVEIRYNNNDYVYKIESQVIAKPNEVSPLATFKPSYLNEATITLMTCWPSGTKAKRLMVRGVLTN